MAVTLTPAGGDPVPVVVWRDDALTAEGSTTSYWPLDSGDPVIAVGPVLAPSGDLTFVYSDDTWSVLTWGSLVTLDTDDCPDVPSREFAVLGLAITHASDDPGSTRLIRATIQATGAL